MKASDSSIKEASSREKEAKKQAAAKKRSYTRRKKMVDSKFDEEKMATKKLKEKFSKKKKTKDEEATVLKIRKKNNKEKVKIENSDSHNNVIIRAEETQAKRQYQLELRADTVSSLYKCAVCSMKSNEGEMGDLFGPYYVNITSDHWPAFLAKKPAKLLKSSLSSIDIWLHGECAVSLPHVHLVGAEVVNLERSINKAWSQKCSICHEFGAPLENKHDFRYLHYSCAKKMNIL